jgi:putative tricarboxylic transport membrane protein
MGDILAGLALVLDPTVFLYMSIGVVVATAFVITPGLGGLFATAMMLPFAFQLGPVGGIALILAVNVVSGTGNTITSILFGIPGSASGVASMFDGYPLARRGEGIRAVSAGLMASALGGVFGAIVLGFALPVLRPLVLAFRPPEFVALILLALAFMAVVGKQDPLKGLISGGIGLFLSLIGMESSTATQRFTFGELYLWDGLPLVAIVLGLYAVTEMIDLMRSGGAIAARKGSDGWAKQMRDGVRAPFTYWKATLQSSIAGLWVGMAPGLGDSAAQFVGYGQVAKTSKNREKFGTGEIEGVIGADAATNTKEGGALIPTLAFGVPGSAGMAIIIAAFLAFGIAPGPDMLINHADIVWMIIWILVIANIMTTIFCLAVTPFMARLTELRASVIVAPILILSVFGAYSSNNNPRDVVVLLLFGVIGWVCKHTGYSRAIILVGFVLGNLLEQYYLLSMRIWGPAFLMRPLTLFFLALLCLALFSPALGRMWRAIRK